MCSPISTVTSYISYFLSRYTCTWVLWKANVSYHSTDLCKLSSAVQPACVVFPDKISGNMFSAIPGRDDEQRWIPSPPDHPSEVKLKTALCRLKHTQVQDKNSWVPVGPRLAGCRVSSAEGVNSTSSEGGPGLWESVIVHVVNALHVSVFELPEKATLSRVDIQRSVNAIAFGVVQSCIEVTSCNYKKWCIFN